MADKLEHHRTKSGVPQEVVKRDLAGLKVEPFVKDYEQARHSFSWKHIEEQFSWHKTGKVNAAYECVDRHALTAKKNKVALYYSDDNRKEEYTFQQLSTLSNKFANVLKKFEVQKGDRVFLFLPRAPELYVSFLGIIKTGAIVGPLFEAFMEDAVRDRIQDSSATVLVTNPELLRRVQLKELPTIKHIILVGDLSKHKLGSHEHSYAEEMEKAPEKFNIEWVGREDGLILHYTSGSTGKPKGALHVHNAMIGHYATGKYTLDLHDEDTYWCTADPGWVTGTSYGIFAPWLNGISMVVRGGRFDVDKWYQTVQDYKVSIWYSAPTAFRLLMAAGDEKVAQYDFSSVRHIYSVGEPLNPEVVKWGLAVFGKTIMENWWMTETGMHLICNFAGMPLKLSSMGKSFPGTEAAIVDADGNRMKPYEIGDLAVKRGWPSMMRQVWNNQEKFDAYFRGKNKEWYVSGDSAYQDEEGYFFFEGRIDDVIKTSGERVGPFEVESALLEHKAVAEAGVIGKPDLIRGAIIKAFVVLKKHHAPSEELKTELMEFVKLKLAAHAKPREIEFLDKLPKTRSGKIMRRVLRAKELGLPMGDLSTMED